MSNIADDFCRYCGKRIRYTGLSSRHRNYCDEKCKQAAYRRRRRFREEPALIEKAIDERVARWRLQGFPDPLIEQLMALWNDHGGQILTKVEQILDLHALWVIERWSAKIAAKSNET